MFDPQSQGMVYLPRLCYKGESEERGMWPNGRTRQMVQC